ncbi:MAG: glutamate-5-semialdehyde dehydrogenase [Actinobacteria bacterium]|nr:glutamate-5-semialdehyde dehydrogenase [Actinomycetota bacterium]
MDADYCVGDRLVGPSGTHSLTAEEASILNAGGRAIVLPDRIGFVDADITERCADGVSRARAAFGVLAQVSDDKISDFFERFAAYLEDDDRFSTIASANARDVADAQQRGRSTGRLLITEKMRSEMVESARLWASSDVRKESVAEQIEHEGWRVEKIASPLGVVAFVFEGRPNVCVDATGVLRTGNSCVFRIGSDALGTARAIMSTCLRPALVESGLPEDAVVLLDESDRSSGWALFSDRRISLAVARGSGQAVSDLGFVAQSNGISTSLHGTGGAWMILGETAEIGWFAETFRHSLDRKVCNTLNVCCAPVSRWREVGTVIATHLDEFSRAKGSRATLHVVGLTAGDAEFLQRDHFDVHIDTTDNLATEWEWDDVPELFFVVTESVKDSLDLCNRYSPQFVASVLGTDQAEQDLAWQILNAPFVGNGFTRWVDGQYALGRPELGLSNWQNGRSLARGGILSGDDIRTYRYRMRQTNPSVHR